MFYPHFAILCRETMFFDVFGAFSYLHRRHFDDLCALGPPEIHSWLMAQSSCGLEITCPLDHFDNRIVCYVKNHQNFEIIKWAIYTIAMLNHWRMQRRAPPALAALAGVGGTLDVLGPFRRAKGYWEVGDPQALSQASADGTSGPAGPEGHRATGPQGHGKTWHGISLFKFLCVEWYCYTATCW
jgi:hypothetical protein